ncbi:hypothetical protein CLV31_10180 [Algoriphagus aquaeductus]|uniref:Uncharacterized protein n=1 Tax=Algoriphagus aquaeductus TaxID=475299 RepID=A0A326S2E3_9BACT|nr:hypothetical protein [Algoriphagus aquaeductus]PZV87208.1 hypothetical protein CLV31_10180 [Algoriphagus aquaeductus]
MFKLQLKTREKWIVTLAIGCSVVNAQGQSGWTKTKGEGFFQSSFSFFASDNYHTLEGELLHTNEYKQRSIVFYGEYGVSDRFTLIANFPIRNFNGFSTTETVSGLGDLRLELKHAILKKYLPLSVSIAPEIPIGRANNFAQSKINDFEQINLPSGDGEFNVWTTLATSFSLGEIPFYGSIFGAYNLRTSYQGISFSDQIGIGAEIGYKIAQTVWLTGRVNGLTSVKEVLEVTDFVRGDGSAYTSYSIGASIPIHKNTHLTLNFRNFGDLLFERKNIYSGGVFTLGIFII